MSSEAFLLIIPRTFVQVLFLRFRLFFAVPVFFSFGFFAIAVYFLAVLVYFLRFRFIFNSFDFFAVLVQ